MGCSRSWGTRFSPFHGPRHPRNSSWMSLDQVSKVTVVFGSHHHYGSIICPIQIDSTLQFWRCSQIPDKNPTIISSWLYTSSYSIFFHCNNCNIIYIYILCFLYCIYSISIWYIYSVSENVSPQTQHKSHWYGKSNAMFTIPIPSPFFWGGVETIPKW